MGREEDGFVLTGRGTVGAVLISVGPKGAPLRRSNFRPIWNAACAKAGMPGLHFHDLKHVGGTLATATGGRVSRS